MDFFITEILYGLGAIILIDLVLAGDNAIVIGMATCNLPTEQRKKAILWGALGAIMVRVLATVIVVRLLEIPGLMIVGGILLIWIAYNLLTEGKKTHQIAAHTHLAAAVKTIIIADGVMGIDNVMGIAGIAHGNVMLVIIGMLVTVPIIIWGSNLFVKLITRYPVIMYIGGSILAWTAGSMIIEDPLLGEVFDQNEFKLVVNIAVVIVLLVVSWLKSKVRVDV